MELITAQMGDVRASYPYFKNSPYRLSKSFVRPFESRFIVVGAIFSNPNMWGVQNPTAKIAGIPTSYRPTTIGP